MRYYGICEKESASVPTSQTVVLATPEAALNVSNPPVVATPPASQAITFYAAETALDVSGPAVNLEAPQAGIASMFSAETAVDVAAPAINLGSLEGQVINMYSAETTLGVKGPNVNVGDPLVDVVAMYSAETKLDVSAPPITLGSPGVETVSMYAAETALWVSSPSVNVDAPGAATVSMYSAETRLDVSAPLLTVEQVGSQTVAMYSAESRLDVSAPALTVTPLASQSISMYSAESSLDVSNPAVVVQPLTAQTVAMYAAESALWVENPAVIVQPLDAQTVAMYSAETELDVSDPKVNVADPPTTSDAACFSGNGEMYTDPFSGGYLTTVPSGFVSVWFRFNNDPLLFLDAHEMAIFQAMNTTQEDVLEMGVGRHANTDYPDLYFQSNDDRGQYTFWTLIEDEEAAGRTVVDLYDGDWHHIVFGFEGPEVDGQNAEWYWYIDGERYGVTHNYDPPGNVGAKDWFQGIQENSPDNFTELNVAFNRLESGQDYVYGCLDELMVVNGRTINDRNAGAIPGQVDDDVAYLYNNGNGRHIDQVEAADPDDLWGDTYNGWRFEQANVEDEYKNPTGTNDHNLKNTQNISFSEGIPGGA